MDVTEQAMPFRRPGRRLILAALLSAGLGVPAAAVSDVRFQNVTRAAGPFHTGETWGASWGDLDGDGYPDLFVSNHRLPSSVYRNNRRGGFSDVTAQVDVSGSLRQLHGHTRDTHGGTWHDFDNDGDKDLFVMAGRQTLDQFFVNEGGRLVDRTKELGFAQVGSSGDLAGRMAIMLDYDRDGWLDLLRATIGKITLHRGGNGRFSEVTKQVGLNWNKAHYAQLTDLDGDGVLEIVGGYQNRFPAKVYDVRRAPFRDVTQSVPRTSYALDSVTGDFDGDGRSDMLVVRSRWLRLVQAALADSKNLEAQFHGSENTMSFRAGGQVTFELYGEKFKSGDIVIGKGGWRPGSFKFTLSPNDPKAAGIKPHDSKRDEKIFVGYVNGTWQVQNSGGTNFYLLAGSTQKISNLRMAGLAPDERPYAPVLLQNSAGGLKTRAGVGFDDRLDCVSGAAGDFDNDMDLDVYLVCRDGVENLTNRLYLNRGNGAFVEVDAGPAAGITGLNVADRAGNGDSVVVADYDVDGFLDLFVTNGINQHASLKQGGGPDELFRNLGNGNNWLQIDLDGLGARGSNRDGIGAVVYVTTADGKTQMREQNGGYHRWSQHFARLHFGLGRHTRVKQVVVEWPGGRRGTYSNVGANRVYRVKEGASSLKALSLGGA